MKVELYKKYKTRCLEDTTIKENIDKTQALLDTSDSALNDYVHLSVFFRWLMEYTSNNWSIDDYANLFCDMASFSPMPESVLKQFSTMLFSIKNLNPLYDLPIYEGYNLDEYTNDKLYYICIFNNFDTKEELIEILKNNNLEELINDLQY